MSWTSFTPSRESWRNSWPHWRKLWSSSRTSTSSSIPLWRGKTRKSATNQYRFIHEIGLWEIWIPICCLYSCNLWFKIYRGAIEIILIIGNLGMKFQFLEKHFYCMCCVCRYQLAENIDAQLKRMLSDLKEIIDHLNSSNTNQDQTDPVRGNHYSYQWTHFINDIPC